MPDAAETDSYEMLREDWGSAYLITRVPGTAHPYQAARRDDPAVILSAADPETLRQLIRADYLARPVPPGGRAVTSPGQSVTTRPSMAAGPAPVAEPGHPVPALTTFELGRYRRELEHAITGIAPDAPVQEDLHRKLGEVLAEQESRTHIQHASRKGARGL